MRALLTLKGKECAQPPPCSQFRHYYLKVVVSEPAAAPTSLPLPSLAPLSPSAAQKAAIALHPTKVPP